MSSKRFEGKNLEEAIDSAAKAFGVESFRVSYHVVLEKRGFLGGTKRVVIEAEVSGAADRKQSGDRAAKPERPAKSERSDARPEKGDRPKKAERPESAQESGSRPKKQEGKPRRQRPDRPKPGRSKERTSEAPQFVYDDEPVKDTVEQPDDKPGSPKSDKGPDEQEHGSRPSRRRGRRGRGGRGRGRGREGERQNDTDTSEVSATSDQESVTPAAEPREPVEIPDQGEQSEEAARVVSWCEEIFKASGLELVARTADTEEEISVELFGRDVELLIESSDYLDSLQVLANKAFTGRTIERPIEFDAGGFKRRREEDLAQRARETADRVRDEGRERTMRAMSPIERRIVHLALEDDRSVTTESRGRGFHKRVVIQPAGEERAVAEES